MVSINRKSIIRILVIIVTFTVFMYFLRMPNFDFSTFVYSLKQSNPTYILFGFIAVMFEISLRIIRFKTIINFYEKRVSLGGLINSYFIGVFVGNITPMKVGEPIKAVILKNRDGLPLTIGVVSAFIERLLDLLTMTSLLLLILFLNRLYEIIQINFYMLIILYLLLFSFYCIFIVGGFVSPILNTTKKIRDKKISPSISKMIKTLDFFLISIKEKKKSQKILFSGFLLILTILIIIVDSTIFYCIFLSFEQKVQLITIIKIGIIGSLSGIISPTPGGIITTEGILMSLYSFFGVPLEISIATILITRAIGFYLSMIVGFFLSLKEEALELKIS